jgi:hypothetical protein
MKPKNWLFATSVVLMSIFAACTPSTPKVDVVENTDSLKVVALALRLDSVQGSLEDMALKFQDVKAQLDALRDSIAKRTVKNPMGNRVKYGGIPKGDPIKDSDGGNGR